MMEEQTSRRRVRRIELFHVLVLLIWILILWSVEETVVIPVTAAASLPASSLNSSGKRRRHHTRLSGFGSRSSKKSIFHYSQQNSGTLLSKRRISSDRHDDTSHSSSLWVQQSKHGHLLRFRCLDPATSTNTTVQVSLDSEDGQWHAEPYNRRGKTDSKDESWVPLEGIYGVYSVPSGLIWVLITSTESVYENKECDWKIHRVNALELVHMQLPRVGTKATSTAVPLQQRTMKEEARQVRLLRHALRQHEFYLVPPPSSNREQDDQCRSSIVRDMTHSWQRALEVSHPVDGSNRNKTATNDWWLSGSAYRPDERFFWNEPSVAPMERKYQQLLDKTDSDERRAYETLLRHTIPVTSMFVGVQRNVKLAAANMTYDQVLMSRRSRFRAGTRFTKRGADAHGHVANYAETEQVLWLRSSSNKSASRKAKRESTNNTSSVLLSHVQTRGSVPLRWSSPADVKTYRPRVRIGTDPLAQGRALRSHVRRECDLYATYDYENPTKYAQLAFVNLIDKKKDQGRLGRAFDAVLQAVLDVYTVSNSTVSSEEEEEAGKDSFWRLAPNMVRHVWFDFHAEVKNGRWDRLGSLLKDLSPTLEEQGYLCVLPDSNWTVVSKQRGVVRTNCMDCLDRTNVVQSLFGRFMMYRQLSECGHYVGTAGSSARSLPLEFTTAFDGNSLALPWSEGETAHRYLWADNADAISRLYAGTPALKGDFTRTGKRTKRGALDDGMNSLQRYYLNNFIDADRQEGMDLLVGHAEFSADDSSHALQEVTRSILLGDVSEDQHHMLHRSSKEAFAKRLRSKGGATSFSPASRQSLDLRWLPGDLQGHMKSHASNVLTETHRTLQAMDRRAASDIPWWVTVDDSSSSGAEGDDEDGSDADTPPLATTTNTGYMIGCLVAAMQAPTTTAASIVIMLGLAGASKRGE